MSVIWASLDDVPVVTGKTVDAPTLALAVSTIELKTGLIQAVTRAYLTRRDYYWLRAAVCFQAAWLAAQPDYLERLEVSTTQQDGQSMTMANADALTLAPMARTAIKKLSWKGTRNMAALGHSGAVRNGNPLAGNTSPLPQYIGPDPTTDGSDNSADWASW